MYVNLVLIQGLAMTLSGSEPVNSSVSLFLTRERLDAEYPGFSPYVHDHWLQFSQVYSRVFKKKYFRVSENIFPPLLYRKAILIKFSKKVL